MDETSNLGTWGTIGAGIAAAGTTAVGAASTSLSVGVVGVVVGVSVIRKLLSDQPVDQLSDPPNRTRQIHRTQDRGDTVSELNARP